MPGTSVILSIRSSETILKWRCWWSVIAGYSRLLQEKSNWHRKVFKKYQSHIPAIVVSGNRTTMDFTNNMIRIRRFEIISGLLFLHLKMLSSSPVLPVMSKGFGVLPQRARGAFVWTQTLLAQLLLSFMWPSLFLPLINSIQKQEKQVLGR